MNQILIYAGSTVVAVGGFLGWAYLEEEQVGRAWVLRQGEKFICVQKDEDNNERDFS